MLINVAHAGAFHYSLNCHTRTSLKAIVYPPVPASPFVRIMAAPSAILLRASPRFLAPHTKGTVNTCLSTWFSSSAGVNTGERE